MFYNYFYVHFFYSFKLDKYYFITFIISKKLLENTKVNKNNLFL